MKTMLGITIEFRPVETRRRPDETIVADTIQVENGLLTLGRDNYEWSFPLDVILKIASREFEVEGESD